jgi:uncharacterized protein with PIN domain
MAWLGGVLSALRTIDPLMQIERKHGELISALSDRLQRIEAREEIVTAEAKAAAATAASAVASQHIGEVARRLGSIE